MITATVLPVLPCLTGCPQTLTFASTPYVLPPLFGQGGPAVAGHGIRGESPAFTVALKFPSPPGISSMTIVPLSCRTTSWRAARSLSVSTRMAAAMPGSLPPSPDSGGVRVGRWELDGEKPLLLLPLLVPRSMRLQASPSMAAATGARPRPPAAQACEEQEWWWR